MLHFFRVLLIDIGKTDNGMTADIIAALALMFVKLQDKGIEQIRKISKLQ